MLVQKRLFAYWFAPAAYGWAPVTMLLIVIGAYLFWPGMMRKKRIKLERRIEVLKHIDEIHGIPIPDLPKT